MEGNLVKIVDDNGNIYDILVATNQKIIKIHKVKDGVNFQANYFALQNLTANAYVLYMYLMLHNSDRIWSLSSKDVMNRTPLKKSTYIKAVHELIEKGYLVKGEINTGKEVIKENAYDFYESPTLKHIVDVDIAYSTSGRRYYQEF